MAVNSLLLYDSSPSCAEPDIRDGYHVGLIVGISWNYSLFLFTDRFIGTMPNLKFYHLASVMVDIKLLCDLSAVVPGEVVTPPCLRGIRLNILVILAVNFILHASAVAVIDFRSTVGKNPFFL